MKVFFGPNKPERIHYARIPNTNFEALVRLRKNIEEIEVEDESTDDEGKPITVKSKIWQADEVSFTTKESKATIENNFDDFYYGNGPQPTLADRLEIVEGLLGEIMEG